MRNILCRVLVPTLIFVVPVSTFGATFVTRGSFIRDAVKVLQLPTESETELPYRMIPKTLLPFVRAAYDRDALKLFGENLKPNEPIKRGEALRILLKLTNLNPANDPKAYSDVRADSEMAKAVQLAVEKNWMRPLKEHMFGVNRLLDATEGKLLMSRLKATLNKGSDAPPPVPTKIRIPINQESSLQNADLIEAILNILSQDYLYKEKLNAKQALYKAADALVKSVDDPYTTYMPPASAKLFKSQIEEDVVGIGAQVDMVNGKLKVVAPIKGSPAERAGVRPGDEILSVNGEDITGLSLDEAVSKVRGPKGSTALLRINRSGEEIKISIVREAINIPEIDVAMEGGTAIITLHQFGQITERDFLVRMKEIDRKDPKGIILDLRNNPGGLLHAAEIVTSAFVPKGTIIADVRVGESGDPVKTALDAVFDTRVPMVVLVNNGSASASEIVAGALQDLKRATIVGEQTFGKGSVQKIVTLRDGSSLKLTIAEWFTPLGRQINKEGIKPDVPVAAGDRDEQLLKAKDLVR